MGLLDILAKLRILRFGAKNAVYHSAKDMPAEFLMDDVVNAKRDLTTKEDLHKAKAWLKGDAGENAPAAARFCTACGAKLDPDAKFCTGCGKAVNGG